MNREARRAAGKNEVKKVSNKALQKWIKSLNKEQVAMITQYAQMQYDKRFNQLTNCLDTVFTAAVIEKLDIPISEIDEIFKNVFDLMEEANFKDKNLRRNKSEKEFEEFMAKTAIDMQKDIIEMLKQGKTQKEIRELLTLRYPLMSKDKITNGVKKTKEEYDAQIEDKELEEAANKIIDIIEPKEISKIGKEPKIKLEPIKSSKVSNVSVECKDGLEVEEVLHVAKQVGEELPVAPKEEALTKKGPLDGIKVRKIEAVGRFANYTAESKRVKFKLDRSFDANSWNAFKNEVEQMFAMMEDK